MDPTPISVMLVDDHAVVRAGLRRLLEGATNIRVVAEASTGEQACQVYATQPADVVVMDITMPGIGGLEAMRRILARDAEAKLLVFSVHENEVFLARALDAGARGYVTKRSAPEHLIEAVRRVAEGSVYLSPDIAPYLVRFRSARDLSPFDRLSTREFEVFRLLAEGRSVQEVADLMFLSPKTVGNHYTQIKRKLGLSSSAEFARLAIRHGLMEP